MTFLPQLSSKIRWISLFLVLGSAGFHPAASAAELPTRLTAENPDFQPVAERRTDGILEDLTLQKAEQAPQIRRYVLNFIIRTKNINEGSTVPENQKRQELEKARTALYAGFDAVDLSDEQRLVIKNGLSANHYRINYDAFIDLVPDLTAKQKQYIHEQLAEVCHEAILLNSGSEKGEMFMKTRGRINNYLSDQGYDLKELSVARNARIREAARQ